MTNEFILEDRLQKNRQVIGKYGEENFYASVPVGKDSTVLFSLKEMPQDAMKPHDTYIIAFCPDTDEFFTTNQRCFFWELDKEFNSEKEAIEYFEDNLEFFLNVDNEIMTKFVFDFKGTNRVMFNKKFYEKD